MLPFFVLVMIIFASMNAYLIWRVYTAFPQMGWWLWLLIAWGLLMTTGPFWVRQIETARWPGLIVYIWLGVVWWFLAAGLVLDAWNAGVWLVGLKWPAVRAAVLSPQVRFGVVAGLVSLAVVWGLIEVTNIQIRTFHVQTSALPPGSAPLRVAMFSDVHLGTHVGERRVRIIVDRLRQAQPDILIGAGDLLDGDIEQIGHLVDMLREVPAPMGKFAVMGNHEFYVGLDETREVVESAGFRLLRGECVQVGPRVKVCGVDDPAGTRRGGEVFLDEQALLPPSLPDNEIVILIKHRPEVDEASIGRFHVQFSGHSHGGQIWPLHLFSGRSNQFLEGLHELGSRSKIIVSRGAGTWGPPLRLLAPPDVVLVVFEPAPL